MKDPTQIDTRTRLSLQAQRITRHYIFALTLIISLIIFSCILMQIAFDIQRTKLRVNALAAEQSRLFTDIGSMTSGLMKNATQDNMPEQSLNDLRMRIKENVERVRRNTDEIIKIDRDYFFGLIKGGAVARIYTGSPVPLEKKLSKFLSRADEIASMDTARLRNRLQQWSPIDVVVSSAIIMQNDFDQAMVSSFKISEQSIGFLRLVELLISVAAIALIVIEALCIFAPLVRTLRREHEKTAAHQDKLQVQSRLDGLTGLGNRLAFEEQLLLKVDQCRRTQSPLGLILFDLDRFKPINDSWGHPAGDALLRAVGERARRSAGHRAFVARLGGDEFGILTSEVDDDDAIHGLVARVKLAIEQSVLYNSHELRPLASFGGAILNPAAPETADWLLGAADAALYKAKRQRLGFALLDEGMKTEAADEKRLAQDFRTALGHAALEVYYQAQVRLADDRLVGFEALVRWDHPERGLLTPHAFLPVAKQYGLMTDLTIFVVNRVADDLRRWTDMGYKPGVIGINIPESMLASGRARVAIVQALLRNGLPPGLIGIEVTEDVLLNHNSEAIAEDLRMMRANGIRVSFDDFGTGYASLIHLKQFPLDEIKIDHSFVRDLFKKDSSAEIVACLVDLAGKLHKTIVAEGIETEEQLAFLRHNGCHIGQGFLFSQPVPFDATLPQIRVRGAGVGPTDRLPREDVRNHPLQSDAA
jgi:diguanylate cyclase (GGDEF)-like protein